MNKGAIFFSSYIVDRDLFSGFTSIFKDENPLHINEQFAISKGFKDKVMYGNILNGFLSHFIGECLPIKNVIIHSQDIKYIKPFFLEDTIELKAILTDYYDSVNVAKFNFEFFNQQQLLIAKGKIQIGII